MTDAADPFRPRTDAELPAPAAPSAPPAWTAPEADPGEAPASPTDAAPVTATAPVVEDEAALLDRLEGDLAAVETAISTIERIATESGGGEHAAAEIRAAVSTERFGG